jgi:hypothetical protein
MKIISLPLPLAGEPACPARGLLIVRGRQAGVRARGASACAARGGEYLNFPPHLNPLAPVGGEEVFRVSFKVIKKLNFLNETFLVTGARFSVG